MLGQLGTSAAEARHDQQLKGMGNGVLHTRVSVVRRTLCVVTFLPFRLDHGVGHGPQCFIVHTNLHKISYMYWQNMTC